MEHWSYAFGPPSRTKRIRALLPGIVVAVNVVAFGALLVAGYGVPVGIGVVLGFIVGGVAGFVCAFVVMGRSRGGSISFGGMPDGHMEEQAFFAMQDVMRDQNRVRRVDEGPLTRVIPAGQSVEANGVRVEVVAVEVRPFGMIIHAAAQATPPLSLFGPEPVVAVADDLGTDYAAAAMGSYGGGVGVRFEVRVAPAAPHDARELRLRVERFTDPFPMRDGAALIGPWELVILSDVVADDRSNPSPPVCSGEMRITFLGQAGFFLETKGVSILADPWFNPAFFASWFPFPANDGIDPKTIGSPTYLYVSHLHHDHFDPRFLSQHVAKDAQVILPAYPLETLRKELEKLGFTQFIETKDLVPFQAGPLTLMVNALSAPTDGPIGDSNLLIDDGDVRVLNMNDSRPIDPDQLLSMGPLDVLFLQFSGAIWYPMVYEFPPRAKEVLAHKKRVAQLARAFRYIEILDPRFVVPSAGPPCFLDDDLFGFNDAVDDETNIFPDQTVFLEYIREQGRDGGRLMLPGTVADIAPGRFDVTHPQPPETIFGEAKPAYLEAYRERKRDVIAAEKQVWEGKPGVDLLPALKPWWEPLLEEADLIASGINERVMLDVGDEQIVVDFLTREVRHRLPDEDEPRYQFFIERSLVEHLVREHVDDWVNELFLSMRFSARRKGPYNDYVYTWFKCLTEERLQYAEGFYAERGPTQGTFELDGWVLQKRCAHMKADLSRFGSIEDGVLTCSLHSWQWELGTGRCLTSDGHQLFSRPVGSDDANDPRPVEPMPETVSHDSEKAAAEESEAEAEPGAA